MGTQRAQSTERQFRTVVRELEQSIWRLLLQPSVGPVRLLQLGAIVELLPNVYVQAVRLAQQEPEDRYVRVWCVVPLADGEAEERTLLCFYTPGFPDPQYTHIRPGMDVDLAWWDAIRVRLAEIAEEATAGSRIAPTVDDSVVLPGPTVDPAESPQVVAPNSITDSIPAATLASPDRQRGLTTPPTPRDPRSKELILREAATLFRDVKRARDESYAHRDQLEQRLTELYFSAYPYMHQATQHATELSVGALIERWIRQGCPAPPPSALSATTPSTRALSSGQPVLDAQIDAAPDSEYAHRSGTSPWPLAVELESIKAVIAEQTRLVERLCELSGGHAPLPRRDPTTGRLVTACERCDAQLAMRAPDQHDTWLH